MNIIVREPLKKTLTLLPSPRSRLQCSPVCESLPTLLSALHGGAEEEVEDDEEDAGDKVDEEHAEPEEHPDYEYFYCNIEISIII